MRKTSGYIEIQKDECINGCCTIKDFIRRDLDPKIYLVMFEKAKCSKCGAIWSSLDNRRWRCRIEIQPYPELRVIKSERT